MTSREIRMIATSCCCLMAAMAAAAADITAAVPSVWTLSKDGKSIEWRVGADGFRPHGDRLEMAGRKVAVVLDYSVSDTRKLTLSRRLFWPGVRVQPNNTYGSMSFDFFATNGIPRLTVDGKVVDETLSSVSFDGVWKSVGTTSSGIVVERRVFPSATAPAAFERWLVRNGGSKSVTVGATVPSKSWTRLGCVARHVISASVTPSAAIELAPGKSAEFTLEFSVRRADETPVAYDGAKEEAGRRSRVAEITDAVRLETDNSVLDAMFRFAKIRACESIFETAGGVMHSPGGERYYAGTWCNDQVEYAGPWFAFTGDALAIEASMNAYRHYMPFMADDYSPIPSSVIAEGRDYWNGAGDRGDAAMWAYGAARFVLASGRADFAQKLRRGLRWALEYCRRKVTADGVVVSDTDEMEGRLTTGKANLNTSVLYYDALRHAAMVERGLGDERMASEYEARAAKLAVAIDRHFGAEMHGFKTYRYFDGCKTLRAWVGIPLCAGIFNRAEGTTSAILSPYLRTRNAGILSEEGDMSGVTWDRSQLYAFRGIFAAGLVDRAWDDFMRYTSDRLLGDHVPYAVEAWPEGGRSQLSAESALYCRAVTEGLFGLEPDGFGSFRTNARLPKGVSRMALRNVRTHGRAFDVVVDRSGTKLVPVETADDLALPGIVSMVWTGEKMLVETSGYADIKAKRPISTNDIFWIASNSKAIACSLVLRYIDRGKIALDEPVATYLPCWKGIKLRDGKAPSHPPTVREVMGHTSGLAFFPAMPITQWSVRELAEKAAREGLDHDVGEYQYSNWGIDVAMAVVEAVGGEPWDKLLKREVLDPLGMTDTTFFPSEELCRARLAKSYKLPEASAPEGMTVDQLVWPYDKPGTHAEAGGGLFSTAGDLMRFFRMVAARGRLQNGSRFISERLMNEWYGLTPYYKDRHYTFGMDINREKCRAGHGGAYDTKGTANYERGTAAVYMTQEAGRNSRSAARVGSWLDRTSVWLNGKDAK